MTTEQSEPTAERRFRISTFNSEHDVQVKHVDVTLSDVFARMTNFRPRRRKHPAPCWSPAEYRDGMTRGAAGVERVNVLVFDLDNGIGPVQLEPMLGGLCYCVATTFSSTEKHWKLRLAIGLQRPIPVEEFDDVWARAQAALLQGNADESARDASRIYFNAAHPYGVTPFSVVHEGALLNWRALPAVPRQPLGGTSTNDLPISIDALDFIANGAPEGEQRMRACAAARSLLSSGFSIERTADLLWQGFQNSTQRSEDPWHEADAIKIAESIAASAPPPLRPPRLTDREVATATLIENLRRPRASLPTHWTAQALMDTVIDPPHEIVPGLLYEGLGVFAARPKFGKSWIAFDMAIAVSEGLQALHSIVCQAGDVHYYALEDGPSRLQRRLQSLLADALPPGRLHISTRLDRLDEGGLVDIAKWLVEHPEASLVIIDTWKRVQPRLKRGQDMDLYGAEYDAANTLKALADHHHVAILLIHHTRKPFKGGSVQDFLDEVLGTSGLTGAADSIIVAKRERNANDAVLYVTGRDVPEAARALIWDEDTHWTIGGDAEQARQSSERAALIDALEADGGWLTPSELAMHLEGKALGAVKMLAWRCGREGLIQGDGEGRYAALGVALPEQTTPSRARTRTGRFALRSYRGAPEGPEEPVSEIKTSASTTVTRPRTRKVTEGYRGDSMLPRSSSTTVTQTSPRSPSVTPRVSRDVTEVNPSQNRVESAPNSSTVTRVTQDPPARTRVRAHKDPKVEPPWEGHLDI